jgi:apolipoprotein N-acyltransferase
MTSLCNPFAAPPALRRQEWVWPHRVVGQTRSGRAAVLVAVAVALTPLAAPPPAKAALLLVLGAPLSWGAGRLLRRLRPVAAIVQPAVSSAAGAGPSGDH